MLNTYCNCVIRIAVALSHAGRMLILLVPSGVGTPLNPFMTGFPMKWESRSQWPYIGCAWSAHTHSQATGYWTGHG